MRNTTAKAEISWSFESLAILQRSLGCFPSQAKGPRILRNAAIGSPFRPKA
jgi:hypothetical protein